MALLALLYNLCFLFECQVTLYWYLSRADGDIEILFWIAYTHLRQIEHYIILKSCQRASIGLSLLYLVRNSSAKLLASDLI